MKELFNSDDVFAIAEEMEVDGAKFYRDASKTTVNPKIKSMLETLAEMEDSHKIIFAAIRKEFADNDNMNFDPSGEVETYLRSLAHGKIFHLSNNPLKYMNQDSNIQGILELAIELENQSILYYTGIRSLVSDKLGKDKIDHVIREEMNHVLLLSGELDAMDA